MQLSNDLTQHIVIFVSKTLGELNRNEAVENVVLLLHINAIVNEIPVRSCDTRRVDRNRYQRETACDRILNVEAGLFKHVMVKLYNEPVCFKQRQEYRRLHIFVEFGIVPADKRLAAFYLPFNDVELRLVEYLEVLICESRLHVNFDKVVLNGARMEHLIVHSEDAEVAGILSCLLCRDRKVDHLGRCVSDFTVCRVDTAGIRKLDTAGNL